VRRARSLYSADAPRLIRITMPNCPVSAVIPVRNGAQYIGEALRSIFDQTARPQQIIVIDDGSTDETPAVVREFPDVDYVAQPPIGASAARNAGGALATQPFLAFLDADDLWLPEKTALQLGHLASNPGTDIVSGQMRNFRRSADGVTTFLTEPAIANLPGCLLMRRDSFLRVGPFSSELAYGENLEWWARLLDRGLRTYAIAELMLLRRVHDSNTSSDPDGSTRRYLGALRAITARRHRERGA
jgi:glycosyltransferase involved in cell wall biosynthesis